MPRKAKSEGIVTELPGVAAVSRALSVLCAFGNEDVSLSLTEISRRTSMYKSTVSRLIESLEAYGMLVRDRSGDFRLGTELIRLGAIARRTAGGAEYIKAALKRLMELTGESATYYVRRDDRRLALYRVDSPKSIRDHIRAGDVLPLGKGAAGRILSSKSRPESDPRRFAVILSLGERDSEVAAIAGPVYSGDAIIGALSVSGPKVRFTPSLVEQYSKFVEEKCRDVTMILATE